MIEVYKILTNKYDKTEKQHNQRTQFETVPLKMPLWSSEI